MARALLPLRQSNGITSARRTGSSTHQSGSPKRTVDHRADAWIVPTADVVHGARLCIIDCFSEDARCPALYGCLPMKSDIVRLEQEFCPSRGLNIRQRGKAEPGSDSGRSCGVVWEASAYPLLVGATRLQPIHSITPTLAKCPRLCMARCPAPGLITTPDALRIRNR